MRKTQRILATTLALAVGLSTVGVSLSALAEEVPMTPASAEPRILPPDSPLPPGEQRRVRGGDVIRFGGTADPAARLVQGRMVTYTPAGAVDQSYVLSSLRLENGQFSGQTTYPGPNSTDAHDGRLVLEVTLAMGEEDDALQVATSNPLRIDLVRPTSSGPRWWLRTPSG